jgi:hypothetical protein
MEINKGFWIGLVIALPFGVGVAAEGYRFDRIVHMSCVEAWQHSGENTQNVVAMIEVLAEHSLSVRQIAFPDTEDAGRRLGDLIEKGCDESPHNLLYNEVDKGIRLVVSGETGTGGSGD